MQAYSCCLVLHLAIQCRLSATTLQAIANLSNNNCYGYNVTITVYNTILNSGCQWLQTVIYIKIMHQWRML